MRAGQALYATRCGPEDTDVIDVIERRLRGSAQQDLVRLAEPGLVASLESELATKRALLPGAVEERARLSALLEDARHRDDPHGVVRISLELNATESLEKDIRVLPMRIAKERKRVAENLRNAQAAAVNTRAAANDVAAHIFGAGYFRDIWEGREHLVPPGTPAISQ